MSGDPQQASSIQMYRRLMTYTWPYKWAFLVSILGMAITSATEGGFAWLMKPMIDGGFVNVTLERSSARNPIAALVTLIVTVTEMVGCRYSPVQTYVVDCQVQLDCVRMEPLPAVWTSLTGFEKTRNAVPPVVAVVQRGSEADSVQPCVRLNGSRPRYVPAVPR